MAAFPAAWIGQGQTWPILCVRALGNARPCVVRGATRGCDPRSARGWRSKNPERGHWATAVWGGGWVGEAELLWAPRAPRRLQAPGRADPLALGWAEGAAGIRAVETKAPGRGWGGGPEGGRAWGPGAGRQRPCPPARSCPRAVPVPRACSRGGRFGRSPGRSHGDAVCCPLVTPNVIYKPPPRRPSAPPRLPPLSAEARLPQPPSTRGGTAGRDSQPLQAARQPRRGSHRRRARHGRPAGSG